MCVPFTVQSCGFFVDSGFIKCYLIMPSANVCEECYIHRNVHKLGKQTRRGQTAAGASGLPPPFADCTKCFGKAFEAFSSTFFGVPQEPVDAATAPSCGLALWKRNLRPRKEQEVQSQDSESRSVVKLLDIVLTILILVKGTLFLFNFWY